jgi:class 3 adenylate cyclase
MLEIEEKLLDKITETFYNMLNSRKFSVIELPAGYPENEFSQMISYQNQFITFFNAFSDFVFSIARGELTYTPPNSKMQVIQAMKALQANLRHLTWKTQQIAGGDFSQQIDFMGDFSAAFNDMTRQLKEAFEKIEHQNKELQIARDEAERERKKSDELLLNILPRKIADELKLHGKVEPSYHPSATIIFTDFKGFTTIAESLTPKELLEELDRCFVQFDSIIEKYGLEKLKTIGDSYMCAGGIPVPNQTHIIDCVLAGIEMQNIMNTVKELKKMLGLPYWEMRLGIHTGPLMAGVIGTKKFAYDVWGDTVNTASRMESSGMVGMVNISQAVYEVIKDVFDCEFRGMIPAKNKGAIEMYLVNQLKPEYSADEYGKIPNPKFFEFYRDIIENRSKENLFV